MCGRQKGWGKRGLVWEGVCGDRDKGKGELVGDGEVDWRCDVCLT